MLNRHIRLLVVASVFVAVSGCREINAEYCAVHWMEDLDCPQGGTPCSAEAPRCDPPTPVCNVDKEMCVQCTLDDHCPPDRKFCDNDVCLQCRTNADCDSALCIDNACIDSAEISYVGGLNVDDMADCTQQAPCATLDRALRLNPARRYIKATGTLDDPDGVDTDGKSGAIFGDPGSTKLVRTSSGPVLLVRKTSTVSLTDLEIVGEAGNGAGVELANTATVTMTRVTVRKHKGVGALVPSATTLTINDSNVIDNDGIGVHVTGGSFTSRRSTISMNRGAAGIQSTGTLVIEESEVLDNAEHGVVATDGAVVIRGSLIRGHGSGIGSQAVGVLGMNADMVTIESSIITENFGVNGGVSISGKYEIRNSIISANGRATSTTGGLTLNSTQGVFEFNTVANNVSTGVMPLGINCVGGVPLRNNILTGNVVTGTCSVEHSLIATMGPAPGDTNKVGEPRFLNVTDPRNAVFYRIGPGSAAIDSADPEAIIDIDIDGQARPPRKADMGADELVGP